MDIRQLHCFLNICKYGSLLQTAQHQYISQQALSKSLIALEREIGAPLFLRSSHGLTLTEIGKTLKEYAPKVIEAMSQLESAMNEAVKIAGKNVSIGTAEGLRPLLNSSVRDQLKKMFPETDITIQEHNFRKCESLTAQGALTLSLVNGPVNDPALYKVHLADCSRLVILPKDHPLTIRNGICLSDLGNCPLALNMNDRCYKTFISLCGDCGFIPDIQRVPDTIIMLNMCSYEKYLSVFPTFLLAGFDLSSTNLTTRPLVCDAFAFPIDLLISPAYYEHKAISDFCDALVAVVQRHIISIDKNIRVSQKS